jgi:hypothetical protein
MIHAALCMTVVTCRMLLNFLLDAVLVLAIDQDLFAYFVP